MDMSKQGVDVLADIMVVSAIMKTLGIVIVMANCAASDIVKLFGVQL